MLGGISGVGIMLKQAPLVHFARILYNQTIFQNFACLARQLRQSDRQTGTIKHVASLTYAWLTWNAFPISWLFEY